MKNIIQTTIYIALFLISLTLVSATQLGINYYHETMMNSNGNHYISRTTTQVGQDLNTIKSITHNVKLYMNPMNNGNLAWTTSVNTIAKSKGMHTVIAMNTEDRTLSSSNWGTYSNSVIAACKAFNGKTDEILVGNEISLHSTWNHATIKSNVVNLISDCKKVFNGNVSYEMFWYEKDAWKGYTGQLYFNMYEDIQPFTTNIKEMDTNFSKNAYIGEFGEDLLDGSKSMTEAWQAQQDQLRWSIIQKTKSPVAYLFTYKEPSYSGFGIVRTDDTKRPSYYIFSASSTPPQPVPTPTPTPTPTAYTLGTLPITVSPSIVKVLDMNDGSCRAISYVPIQVKICSKGTNTYEMYLLSKANNYKVCVKTYCVGANTGFMRFTI